ncbi:MAG: LEPR-XLL domain-containing protein, partial [Planctomycetes bacterium]|nr:LEPR-XLL domain-containing protein [Planctomycetota bacterium]
MEKVRPVRASVFEPLEHRVLMDAALAGVPPAPSPEGMAPAQVVVGANDYSPVPPASGTEAQAQQAMETFDVSPALFVENQGQWSDPSVRYVHDGNCVDVAALDQGIVFQVARTQTAYTDVRRFSASFAGACPVLPTGLARSPTVVNYFIGDSSLWRPDVPAYEQLVYKGLYDGIDLYVQGLVSHLKYEFHVAPGADWSPISIRYDGIAGLSLADDGALVVDLGEGWGTLRDDRPYIYQVIDGQRVGVAGSFRLLDSRTCAFDVTGPYDPAYELVIDPNLVWSTYLGGSGWDWGYRIAV